VLIDKTLAGIARLNEHPLSGLQSLGDFQDGVDGGNEFRAGRLQPTNRHPDV
jgi:hypothetical protein